jgi:hypothetical protein
MGAGQHACEEFAEVRQWRKRQRDEYDGEWYQAKIAGAERHHVN